MQLAEVITTVRRRRLVDEALRRGARGLVIALLAGLVVLLADRLLGWTVPVAGYVGLAAVGALAGAATAAVRRRDDLRVAVDLDRRLDLEDRLASALALRLGVTAPHDRAFASMLDADAERRAARVIPAVVAPITFSRQWLTALGLSALLVVGGLFLPRRGGGGDGTTTEAPLVSAPEPLPEAETLAETLSDLAADPEVVESFPEELDALDRLAEQMHSPPASDEDARRLVESSAGRLSELADEVAEQARRDLEASDEIARRFREQPTPDVPKSAEEFAEALARGEYGDAAERLEEWMESASSLPEAERRQAAEALRRLAEMTEAAGGEPPRDLAERAEQLEQVLRDQGLDEDTIDELLARDDVDSETVEEMLRERGAPEEIARDIARDLDELDDRRDVQEQVQRDTETLADAMDRAADDVEESAAPPPDDARRSESPSGDPEDRTTDEAPATPGTGPDPNEPTEPDRRPTPDGATRDAPTPDPNGTPDSQRPPAPDGATREEPTPDPNGTPDSQRPPAPDGATREEPTPDPNGTPDSQRPPAPDGATREEPTPDPNGTPDSQRPPTPDGATREEPTPDPNGTPDSQRPPTPDGATREEPTPDPNGTPDSQRQPAPDGATPNEPTPDPNGSPDMQRRPAPDGTPETPRPGADGASEPTAADTLREMAQRRRRAEERREMSESMQRRAEELLEGADPEQRRRWAEQWAREGGPGPERDPGSTPGDATPPDRPSPLDTEDAATLDLRGDEPTERTVAEWLSDERPTAPGDPAARGTRRRVRDAQQVAERAVEESAVPSRYHRLIKQYFRRLPKIVEESAGTPGDEGGP